TPFRIPDEVEPWPRNNGPLRAAVSSFGFGGNNAHLVIEEYERKSPRAAAAQKSKHDVVVVALAARASDGRDTREFVQYLLFATRTPGEKAAEIRVRSTELVFPPRDLERALPQQMLLLSVAREAVDSLAKPISENAAVLAGIQCDAEGTRPTLRLALAELL